MSGKSEQLHNIAFYLLFQHAFEKYGLLRDSCCWANVVMDFDSALIPSLLSFFPMLLSIYGCYFHKCQAIYRHINTLGLSGEYNDDSTGLNTFVKKYTHLHFCPKKL